MQEASCGYLEVKEARACFLPAFQKLPACLQHVQIPTALPPPPLKDPQCFASCTHRYPLPTDIHCLVPGPPDSTVLAYCTSRYSLLASCTPGLPEIPTPCLLYFRCPLLYILHVQIHTSCLLHLQIPTAYLLHLQLPLLYIRFPFLASFTSRYPLLYLLHVLPSCTCRYPLLASCTSRFASCPSTYPLLTCSTSRYLLLAS